MGTSLSESSIAEKLRISRTPVREAFRLLAKEGLVQLRPFAGASVFRVSKAQLRHLETFREMLEVTALEAAVQIDKPGLLDALRSVVAQMREAVESNSAQRFLQLDADFHETILSFAGNPLLCEAYQLVASRFMALRTFIANDQIRLTRSLASHVELVDLISSVDIVATRDALIQHIRNWEKNFETDSPMSLED